jgi:hypothetical protein
MQQPPQSTLDVIYENWHGHHEKLRACIAPLTPEQLALQPAAHMWPINQLVQHIISVRAGWFSGTLQDEDPAMSAYMEWGQRESPARSAAELVRGLDETWAFHPDHDAPHVLVIGFMAMWMGFIGLLLAGLLFAFATAPTGTFDPTILIPAGMLIFGYALILGGFKVESARSKQFFQELFEASVVEEMSFAEVFRTRRIGP